MRAKGFFNFYGVYLQIILAAVAIVVTLVGRDVLVQNWPVSAAIALVVLLVPCLVFGIASFRGLSQNG